MMFESIQKERLVSSTNYTPISIIVPTFQRAFIIKQTLIYLLKQDYSAQKYEIIVVDDGSGDNTSRTVEELQSENSNLKYAYQKNSGAAAARNLGAKTAKYELLLFIDDDILLEADSLEKISDFHRKYQDSILSGSWVYSEDVLQSLNKTPFGRFKIENDYTCMGGIDKTSVSDNLYETKSLASFCLSMPKSVFKIVGGFNENFPYAGCEDQEFSAKAIDSGIKLYYSQNIKTFHNELDRGEKEKWLNRQFTGVQGFPLLCELYPERKTSALYDENAPIDRKDGSKLKVKKRIKKFAYGRVGFKTVAFFTNILEKSEISDRILSRLYNLMAGMMIYQGFQIGYDNLKSSELENNKNLKESSLQT